MCTGFIWFRIGAMANCSQDGYEISGSIKSGE